ncbi:hypothetical protein [Microcoleus vaginatus]|uniref:hypothetical protein n=1 Tax=Microcoleus vaginatus TaxID=119532 RepID=UPI001F61751D
MPVPDRGIRKSTNFLLRDLLFIVEQASWLFLTENNFIVEQASCLFLTEVSENPRIFC